MLPTIAVEYDTKISLNNIILVLDIGYAFPIMLIIIYYIKKNDLLKVSTSFNLQPKTTHDEDPITPGRNSDTDTTHIIIKSKYSLQRS